MADRVPEPVEAKRYLSRKAIVETEKWDDLKWGEHAHAFTVAHSRNAGVLNDIFGMLNSAVAEGKSFNTFKSEMKDLMAAKGWYGRSDKGPDDKKYINWRTKLIYHTNMSTAYNAGRYREQLRGAALRPIWEYVSLLFGKNRREDHIALHGKAFRYDDPFWNTNYPKNGWGCECEVVTLSESGAEREGIEILKTGPDGNPPAMVDRNGNAVDWNNFTPETWRYNAGLEVLAPDFSSYKNLSGYRMDDGRTALAHVAERYRQDMDDARFTLGEFKILLGRMDKKDYVPQDIFYQVGNLDRQRHEAMMKKNVSDSKIMAFDRDLYHGTADKNTDQKIPADLFETVYQNLQTPERIYEETKPKYPNLGRVFHFVKGISGDMAIKIVTRQKLNVTALRVITMGIVSDQYDREVTKYDKILW